MRPICYENTKTDLPGWVDTVHHEQKYGYAYETASHFVHFYGKEPYYIISAGLTVTEAKSGTLEDWVKQRFGASNIEEMDLEVGHTIEGIWRPALFFWEDTSAALKIDPQQQVSQESALRILIQQLDNLLLYIEPSVNGMECYSHKTRELLILSCTEVENQWRSILKIANQPPSKGSAYTTNDYAKLIGKAFLEEFAVGLRNSPNVKKFRPFDGWIVSTPTKSLSWYMAYNETKHDRHGHFDSACLKHVVAAIAANIVLYSIRFSPLTLINGSNAFSGLVNQMFQIEMEGSRRKAFYIPLIDTSKIARSDCIVFDSYRDKLNQPWVINNLRL